MEKKKKINGITWANFLDSIEEADAVDKVSNCLDLEKINEILWDHYEDERPEIIEFLLEQGYLLYNQTGIPPYFFQDCTNLTDVFIPKEVIYIGEGAFKGCSNLTIYCEASSQLDEDEEWDTGDRPVHWGINKNTFVDIIEIEGIEYVIKDEKAIVNKCIENNTEVIIPSTIEINGTTYNVTSIKGYAFTECDNLTSITLPNSLTSIGEGAFYNCSSLTNIVIPEGVTSIGKYAFFWCCDLKSITLPNTLTNIGYKAFQWCALTNVKLPESLTTIEDSAFCDCRNLTSIVIPNGVTSIGEYVLCDCWNLTNIKLPDTLTSIGYEAFCNCRNLTNITLPESLASIGYRAFHNCNNLKSIVIPAGVTNIEASAFWWCDNLTIYCNCDENNMPAGWDSYWNNGIKEVYWKNQWKYINGVPTPIKR